MLENMDDRRVLKALSGLNDGIMPLRQVTLNNYDPGTIFRAVTESGNRYLFEIVDPMKHTAHVVRMEARPGAPKTGYRGVRQIVGDVKIGHTIKHGDSVTSRVTQLVLIG